MRTTTATIASILMIAIAGFNTAFGQEQKGSNSLQAEIERLHNQWFTAFDKGDGATMDRMEVPNLVLVNVDGRGGLFVKSGPRAGKQKPTGASSRTLSNVQVRQFGDTAILTGLLTSKGGGETALSPTTVVWVRQNNQWMVASAQWSSVSGPAAQK